ncbi:MAG: hypothetical protein M3010_01185, partial [Candidatus Dormibacteraeota bacterium]|nr:hypothetical protein [Candidatus Dormibacteraeota bacterium]
AATTPAARRAALTMAITAAPAQAGRLIDLAQGLAAEPYVRVTPHDLVAVARSARRTLAAAIVPARADLRVRARAVGLSFAALAVAVDLSIDVLTKLDRAVVDPATVPLLLWERLSRALACPIRTLRTALAGGPRTASALYHSTHPPHVSRQSFAAAVASSQILDAAARAFWLAAT